MPDGVTIDIASIRGIPLYDGDVEAAGRPSQGGGRSQSAHRRSRCVAARQRLSTTTAFRACSRTRSTGCARPPADIRGIRRAAPLLDRAPRRAASGTILAQEAWLAVLRARHAAMVRRTPDGIARRRCSTPKARLTDEALRKQLTASCRGSLRSSRRARRDSGGGRSIAPATASIASIGASSSRRRSARYSNGFDFYCTARWPCFSVRLFFPPATRRPHLASLATFGAGLRYVPSARSCSDGWAI